jgi:hypothetical protein
VNGNARTAPRTPFPRPCSVGISLGQAADAFAIPLAQIVIDARGANFDEKRRGIDACRVGAAERAVTPREKSCNQGGGVFGTPIEHGS